MEVTIQLTDEEAAKVERLAAQWGEAPTPVVAKFVRNNPAWRELLHGDEYQHRGFVASVKEPAENC